MADKFYDIYIVGVGGQGVLTIADIITLTAAKNGVDVNYYPTKGMAQRWICKGTASAWQKGRYLWTEYIRRWRRSGCIYGIM